MNAKETLSAQRPPLAVRVAVPVGLFCLSLFLRLQHIALYQHENSAGSVFWLVDSLLYHNLAAIVFHDSINHMFLIQPPGIYYFIGFFYRLLDADPVTGKTLLAVVGSLSVVLTYALALRLAGFVVAVIASLVLSFSFGSLMMAGGLNSEVLAQCLLLVLLFVLMARKSVIVCFVAGIVGGLCALVRAEFTIFFFLFFIVSFWRFGIASPRRASLMLGVVFAGYALTLAPWAVRNHNYFTELNGMVGKKVFPTLVPVTVYGGFNFAVSNSLMSQGGSDRRIYRVNDDFRKWEQDVLDPKVLDLVLHGYRRGLEFIAGHPGTFLHLLGKRVLFFLEVFTYGYGNGDYPAGTGGSYRMDDVFNPTWRWMALIHIPLLCVGLIAAVRRTPGVHLLPVTVLSAYFGLNLFFFGYTRSSAMLFPLFAIYIAVGLRAAWQVLPGGGWKGCAGVIAGVVLMTVVVALPYLHPPSPRLAEFLFNGVTVREDLSDDARREAIRAYEERLEEIRSASDVITNNQDLAYRHAVLGYFYRKGGEADSAVAHYETAVTLDPINHDALNSLVHLYLHEREDAEKAAPYLKRLRLFYPQE